VPDSSLGGARPKACFTESDGRIWIAKFPTRDDRYDVGAWECIVHQLACSAEIWVPESRPASLTPPYRAFCLVRFDRKGKSRRMYASAITLLEREDGAANAGYLDIAELSRIMVRSGTSVPTWSSCSGGSYSLFGPGFISKVEYIDFLST